MNKIIEEYKNKDICLEEAILLLDKYNYSEDEIKKGGIVYTPKYIADYIVQSLRPTLNETIMEPSVGHGIFLFSLLDYIVQEFGIKHVKNYFLQQFTGFDIEATNINELSELVCLWFRDHNIDIELSEVQSRLTTADTLKNEKTVDIIFGNPPYIRIQNIEDQEYRDFLRSKYESCAKGNIDIYYAFTEYAFKNSGRCSYIVPSSYIKNASAKTLRNLIGPHLSSIIDFKEKKVFEGGGTYTSIFNINKNIDTAEIGLDVKYGHTGAYDLDGLLKIDFDNINIDAFINNKVLGGKNFNIEEVFGSIATLRDKIYLVKDDVATHNHDGGSKEYKIDHNDSVAYLKCTKLKNISDIKKNKSRMISPYDAVGKLRDWSSLDANTKDYLDIKKKELALRDKGKQDKYERWYSYGRTQGINNKVVDDDDKYSLIIVPGMFSKDNNFFSFKFSDIGENYYLTSGFIIKVLASDADDIVNYLNDDEFINLCDEYGTVRPGKSGKYYSISKKIMLDILT